MNVRPWHALLSGMTLAELEAANRELWKHTFEFTGVPREEIDTKFDARIDYLKSVELLKARPEAGGD